MSNISESEGQELRLQIQLSNLNSGYPSSSEGSACVEQSDSADGLSEDLQDQGKVKKVESKGLLKPEVLFEIIR